MAPDIRRKGPEKVEKKNRHENQRQGKQKKGLAFLLGEKGGRENLFMQTLPKERPALTTSQHKGEKLKTNNSEKKNASTRRD